VTVPVYSNFWNMSALTSAAKELSCHTLSMFICVEVDGRLEQLICSGFLYRANVGLPLWLTAGHVVDELRRLRSSSDVKVHAAHWLDGDESMPYEARARPLPIQDLREFGLDDRGLDFGGMLLRQMDLVHLERSGKRFITPDLIANRSEAPPPGSLTPLILGVPHQSLSVSKSMSDSQFDHYVARSYEIAVPGVPIEDQREPGSDFWNGRGAFYLRCGMVPDNFSGHITHLGGMSGSPVYVVWTTNGHNLHYRLAGIQSACATSRPNIVRCTDIEIVRKTLDEFYEQATALGYVGVE
jgi:hypothetical protein